jgi:hypothetical protein
MDQVDCLYRDGAMIRYLLIMQLVFTLSCVAKVETIDAVKLFDEFIHYALQANI